MFVLPLSCVAFDKVPGGWFWEWRLGGTEPASLRAQNPRTSKDFNTLASNPMAMVDSKWKKTPRDPSTFSEGDWGHSYVGFEGPSTF